MKSIRKNSREHPLDEWLSFEQESISRFKNGYPELWQVFGDSINLARAIPLVIGQQAGLTGIEMHRLFLWQKVLHYQTQSLFLLLQSQLDAGFALLRLAAELSRDVIRIGDDEKLLAIWFERESKPNEYKKRFKFIQNSPNETAVHTVYKFASKFGVHGHRTDTMFSEVIETIGENGSMLSFGVSNYGVFDAVHMWMLSFLPMHHICANSFIKKYFPIRPEIFLTLRDYEVTMNSVIQSVSETLETLMKPTK
jgi:hypothetical protein